MTDPIVVYRCVVALKRGGGHGLKIAGIVNDDGRPLLGRWNRNDGKTSWVDEWYLDEGKIVPSEPWEGSDPPIMKLIDGAHIICYLHGLWTLPRTALLEHWDRAARSSRQTIKLDDASSWRSRVRVWPYRSRKPS